MTERDLNEVLAKVTGGKDVEIRALASRSSRARP